MHNHEKVLMGQSLRMHSHDRVLIDQCVLTVPSTGTTPNATIAPPAVPLMGSVVVMLGLNPEQAIAFS